MAEEEIKASITLTRFEVKEQKLSWINGIVGYLLEVSATGTGVLADGNIFVMQLGTDGYNPDQGDQLLKVATVFDIYELPTEDQIVEVNGRISASGKVYPFYRTNKASLFFESVEAAENFFSCVKKDAKSLVTNLNLETNKSESIVING